MKVRIPQNILPKPKKIATRGLYELINMSLGHEVKKRNYEKKIKKGRY